MSEKISLDSSAAITNFTNIQLRNENHRKFVKKFTFYSPAILLQIHIYILK